MGMLSWKIMIDTEWKKADAKECRRVCVRMCVHVTERTMFEVNTMRDEANVKLIYKMPNCGLSHKVRLQTQTKRYFHCTSNYWRGEWWWWWCCRFYTHFDLICKAAAINSNIEMNCEMCSGIWFEEGVIPNRHRHIESQILYAPPQRAAATTIECAQRGRRGS